MQILGISKRQTEILKSLKLGMSYSELSDKLGIHQSAVIIEEMRALDTLSHRWKMNEARVKEMLLSIFLVFIVLLPLIQMSKFTRPVRTQGRTSNMVRTIGRKGDSLIA